MNRKLFILFALFFSGLTIFAQSPRHILDFNDGWMFLLEDDSAFSRANYNDKGWRKLDLPHDWSIEGRFDSIWPAGNGGGALPGGIGWYRKTFTTQVVNKKVYIEFDGIFKNSEVWINGHYLQKWPYGYTSFRYDLTKWLRPDNQQNVIAVRVDNSLQPNSRWYTGSGIYRDVKLVTTNRTAIKHWGTFITTPEVSHKEATVAVEYDILKSGKGSLKIISSVYDAKGNKVKETASADFEKGKYYQNLHVENPILWSVDYPHLYKMVSSVFQNGKLVDQVETSFGIRFYNFDADEGFSLNGEYMKILGVCQHHDLGALGAAFNASAAKRQLRILKEMGVNAIRMAHNPPAAKLLDLCDEMGFLVMDESFDMWAKKKNKYDYHLNFREWHGKDLEHMVKRDRNHPSIIMWSIGNEIREQFDSSGIRITRELVRIVKQFDTTRPVICALSESEPEKNFIYQSGALDVVAINYKIDSYKDFQTNYPGQKMIASENVSGLASRGHYDMPSDSLRLWPPSSKYKYVPDGNPDFSVSAYDNVAAYWGTTHENNWWQVKRYKYVSGLFVWSGFDFMGEPVPYPYPARSSYYGIIDLAGFPKDVYYMYQSEWTDEPVLHVFPHWNWEKGKLVDVKAYFNKADEVELFLNGKSLGRKSKTDSTFHVMWRVPFEPGEIKAVSYNKNRKVLERKIKTAGDPYKIELAVENSSIDRKAKELSFITIKIVDKDGNIIPDADNMVRVEVDGPAEIVAMDNGFPADLTPFQSSSRRVYKGLALAFIKANKEGTVKVKVSSTGLKEASTSLEVR